MEMTLAKKNLWIIKVMFFVRYLGDALFYGFFTRFLYSLGFSNYLLGILFAIQPLMAVVGNIVLSKISSTRKTRKALLFIWTIVEAIAILCMGFASNFYLVLVLELICTFCSTSFYNLLDTFAVECTTSANKTYASLRIYGSSAYVVGTFIGGLLIKNITYKYDFLISTILYFISIAIFFFIKFEDEKENTTNDNESDNNKVKLKDLFTIKPYIFYLIFIIIFLGINTSADSLYGAFTSDLNVPDDIFGYFSSATIIVECIVLFIGSLFTSSKHFIYLMLSAVIALVLRLVIFSIPNLNSYIYLSAQLLRGITFGLYLSAHIALLKKIVSPRYLSQAIFITTAFQQCFSAILNQITPIISDVLSFNISFVILLSILSLSFIFLYLTKVTYKNMKLQNKNIQIKE